MFLKCNAAYAPAKRGDALKTSLRRHFPGARSVLLLLLLCLNMHSVAQKSSGLVTLNVTDVPLEKVFKQIQHQTGYRFLYEQNLLVNAKNVTLKMTDQPVETALERCFAGQPFRFRIIERTVVVSSSTAPPSTTITPTRAIGTVINATTHEPIFAASVSIKGVSHAGMITDQSGHFDLPAQVGDQLTVSYLGFDKKELRIESTGPMVVALQPAANALNEVVVSNGYQELDQRTMTSAITSLKAKDIVMPGMFTIDQALEGWVPGLFVLNNSGEVGTAPRIRVRGTSTILGNQEPVWVVDGVVVNSAVNIDPQTINDLDFVNRLGNAISGLNPQDIDQINVLKDASATALYGVRAANGVIVITTKKGHPGPPVVSYSVSGTLTRRPRYTDHNINVMNSRERVDYSREIIAKGLDYPTRINYVGYEGALHNLYTGNYTYDQFEQAVGKLETMNTDWFSAITQNAVSEQHTLTVSGGSNAMRYYASLGLSNEPGTVRGDHLQRYNSTVNLNADITNRLQWNFSLLGDVDKRDFVASSVKALTYAYNTARDIPVYADGGGLSYYQAFAPNSANSMQQYFNYNIVNEMQHSRDVSNGNSIRVNTNLNYRFNEALKGMVLFSYTNAATTQDITYDANTYYATALRGAELGDAVPLSSLLPVGGELQTNATRNNSYTVRGQLDYNHLLHGDGRHQLSATLGGETSSNRYIGYTTIRRGYMPDRGKTFAAIDPLKYTAYASWALSQNVDKMQDQLTNLVSGYLSAAYTYNHVYTLNFNTRSDFSNKFGSRSNEKFLPTWSVSGRWDIAQDLLKQSRTVDLLAFRGSYGYQGNMLEYQTPNLIIKQGAPDPITGENESAIAYYPNPTLRWERTVEINTALDFSLFHNKLAGSLTYFYKKTRDAFVNKQVTDVNGVDNYVVNAGNLVNRGIEVVLSFTPINNSLAGGKGFKWRLDPQLGQVINRLIARSLVNSNTQSQEGEAPNGYLNYLNGTALLNNKPIHAFYAYQFNGLSAMDGRPTFKNDDPSNADAYSKMTYDQVYQTVMKPVGNRIPTLQGGVNNYFSYNNYFLSCNVTYSFGAKIRLLPLYTAATQYSATAAPLPEQNLGRDVLRRWEQPGDEAHTNIPGLLKGQAYASTINHWSNAYNIPYRYADNIWQMYDNSDTRVVSGNYVKISSVQLGYKLSPAALKTYRIKDAYLSLSGNNLYTFASKDLHGQDPSQAGFSTIQLSIRPSYSFNISVSL